jgi:NADPH:quinone reductase-like Zn-dependent oxidoreductase
MSSTIPETMQAAELRAYTEGVENIQLFPVTRPVPKPGNDEVLVKIAASPINPSDLAFLQGSYGFKKRLPVIGGFEAGGTVVASGGGKYADELLGKRVACTSPFDKDGSWAEYMVASANSCITLIDGISEEQGSMVLVNPLTAYAMLDIARNAGAQGVVQTAAAGALGQMLFRLAKSWGINCVNIVRRPEQAELMKSIGADVVVDSSSSRFERDLLVACKKNQATFAFDAVAGDLTGKLAGCMPRGSRIMVYGGLSEKPIELNPGVLIFMGQQIEGFWLSPYLDRQGPAKIREMSQTVQSMLTGEMASQVRLRLPVQEAQKAVQEYARQMTGGKVLIVPGA